MDDHSRNALKQYRKTQGIIPIRIAAHWLIRPAGDISRTGRRDHNSEQGVASLVDTRFLRRWYQVDL